VGREGRRHGARFASDPAPPQGSRGT
jgi:hypothetical protein